MFTFKRNQIIITVLVFMIAIAAYLNTKDNEAGMQANLGQEPNMSSIEDAEEVDFFAGYDDIETLPPDSDPSIDPNMEPNMEVSMEPSMDSNIEPNMDQEMIAEVSTQTQEQTPVLMTETNAPQVEKIEAVITRKDAIFEETKAQGSDNVVAADNNMDVSYFVEEKMLREQSRALQVEELTQYVANENLDKEAKSKAAENLLAIQERIEKESGAEALLRAKGFREVYVRIDDNSVDVVINKENLSESDIAQIEEIVNRKTGYSVGKIKITPLKGIAKENANQ